MDLRVEEDHACMPTALNFYFSERIFNSRLGFFAKQQYNLKLAKVRMDMEYSQILANSVELHGEMYKREQLYTSTRFGYKSKYDLDKFLNNLPDAKYIFDYTYKKSDNHRKQSGHFICVEKVLGKIFVISDEVLNDEIIPRIEYKLNEKPNLKDKRIDLRKKFGIISFQVFIFKKMF